MYSLAVIFYELLSGYPILCTISHSGTVKEVENHANRSGTPPAPSPPSPFCPLTALGVSVRDCSRVSGRVAGGYRVKIPAKWPPEVGEVITKLWTQDPKERPSATEAIKLLTGLQPVVEAWHRSAKGFCSCFG